MIKTRRNQCLALSRRSAFAAAGTSAAVLVFLAYPGLAEAQAAFNIKTIPPAFWLAVFMVVLLFAALGFYIYVVWRRESEARRRAEPVRRTFKKASPDNPVWRDTGKGRRGRDLTDLRPVDDDLPPITLLTGATWADKGQEAPRQSTLIAESPQSSADNVYKSGYNPFFRSSGSNNIEVEEVADLVQQAELMITLANYPAAISMLTRHIRDTEKPSPKAWLMLFDLYAKTEREEQYTNLARGFRIQFNADVPSWNAQKTGTSRQLEDYPMVMDRVCKAWPTAQIRDLLNSLLFDDRGGARAGFMLEAYSDLLFLLDIVEQWDSIEREIAERREIEAKLRSKPLV